MVNATRSPESTEKNRAPMFAHRMVSGLVDIYGLVHGLPRFIRYLNDLREYRHISSGERVEIIDLYPLLHDETASHPFDRHYFYQDWWAFDKIARNRPEEHVDVASRIDLASFLSSLCRVKYVDVRPLSVTIPNLTCLRGDLSGLPFDDDSVKSMSCLHVAEHVGLGRYGDNLDPEGTKKACKELARVLAPGGSLYFSVPIGSERVCFNAHRIHKAGTILSYFEDLQLAEFSGIDDRKGFLENLPPEALDCNDYGCGLFHFTKRK
ncbi:MAG: DUF268 domain-containing protein [Thermoplasmata archaeon]|nr:DUF268 domain-containing protein [Thermoplasmata archaeon]